ASFERLVLLSVPSRTLATPLERAVPEGAHVLVVGLQRGEVRGHSIVVVVPSKNAREPRVLHTWRLVPTLAHLLSQRRKLGNPLLPGGTTNQSALAIAQRGDDVREAEKVERLRPQAAIELTVSERKAPKPNHPS